MTKNEHKKDQGLLVAFSPSERINDLRTLICSSVLLDFSLIQELHDFRNLLGLEMLSIKGITIFWVVKHPADKFRISEIAVRISDDQRIRVIETSIPRLIQTATFRGDVLKKTDLTNRIFFLFEDFTWNEVVYCFRLYNIVIIGGSSKKRYLLSPLQFRLSKFLISFELAKKVYATKTVNESFYSDYSKGYWGGDLTSKKLREEFNTYKHAFKLKEDLADSLENLEDKDNNDKELKLSRENITETENITDKSATVALDIDSNTYLENSAGLVNSAYKSGKVKLDLDLNSEGESIGSIDKEIDTKEGLAVEDKVIESETDKIDGQNRQNNNDELNTHEPYRENKSNSLFMNDIQKRQFHSFLGSRLEQESGRNLKDLSIREENVEDVDFKKEITTNKNIIFFSYLDEIINIIKENQDNIYLAQKQIETLWLRKMKAKLEDPKYLNHRLVKLLLTAKQTLDIYSKHYSFKRRFPSLYKELNKIEYLMLTFSLVLTYHSRVGHTALAMIVGNNIIYQTYKEMIKEKGVQSLEIENFTTYNQYKELLKLNKAKILKIGAFFIDIMTTYPSDIFERSIHHDESKYGELAILTINSDHLEEIKKNIIIPPSSLPMICEPNQWSDNSYGGFLENKFEQIDLITGSGQHKHSVENRINLYKAINYLNSMKFRVNVSLLNYLENKGHYLLNIDNKDLSKSESLQREITLKIAKTFLNITFYINTHADFRGRIYTQSFFLSYQSGDLPTALLELNDGIKLSESGKRYLYIYGANLYNDNNLSKKSYDDRISWVKLNYLNILRMEPDFLSKAESRFLFAAFCLIMREIDTNSDTLIHFPVFLDATCSGIQHFSALLKDFELGNKVNLKKQTDRDKVEDIYSEMIEPINKAINEYGDKNHDFISLSLVKLNRKLLKPLIMTKLYNSTPFGMAQQLKANLIIQKSALFKDFQYQAPGTNGPVLLNNLEILKIGNIVHEQIFYLYPSLKSIYSYFLDIVKLCINLGVPVVWITPAGLKITQSYARSILNKVAINMGGKTKSMILREWSEKLDKGKQKQGIIPNIIHSLDATHLINLLCLAEDNKFKPVLSIHDCFGTHPNKLEELSFMVKNEFLLLYTQSHFLENFHERIIQTIKDNQYTIQDDKENNSQFIIINRKKHYIPQIPKLGILDLHNILESKYMIS